MRFGFLLRDIPNKDAPRREPRRPFGRAIVNKASLLYPSILSLSFNRLPHNRLGGDTRIGHAGSTQKQKFGSCANRYPGPPDRPDVFHSFRSKFHPDLASTASHVDHAEESLRALQESADAFPNPHLKSAVSGVSALWQTAKVERCVGFLRSCMFYQVFQRVEQSKKDAQAWSQHSLNVLETLAEAVGHGPFNTIPPLILRDIRSFEE